MRNKILSMPRIEADGDAASTSGAPGPRREAAWLAV